MRCSLSDSIVRLAVPIACVSLAISQDVVGQEPRETAAKAGVLELLDRIERSWKQHDIKALSESCADSALFIVRFNREGPIRIMTKEQTLAIVAAAWKQAGINSHRFVRRRIRVFDGTAWMYLTVCDRFADGRMQTREAFNVALYRDGKWRMCFSMPRFFNPVVVVTGVAPGSLAEKLDIRAGDIVTSYAGRRVWNTAEFVQSFKSLGVAGARGKRRLVVLRGGKRIALEVPAGEFGLRVADRLLPILGAKLVTGDASHPIKNLLREELDALKKGEVDDYVARFLCPVAVLFLQPRPGRSPRVLTLTHMDEEIRKEARDVGRIFRLKTARFEGVRLIVDGDLAVMRSQFVAKLKGREAKTIRTPVAFKVYVRLNGKWGVAAGFSDGLNIGVQGAGSR